MYHKVKNTLAGLVVVAAFTIGGVALGEPVPAKAPQSGLSIEASQAALALTLVHAAISLAQAEAMAEIAAEAQGTGATPESLEAPKAKSRPASRQRLELGMPYYSFGAMLPRRRES
jgi:hypothetical protein